LSSSTRKGSSSPPPPPSLGNLAGFGAGLGPGLLGPGFTAASSAAATAAATSLLIWSKGKHDKSSKELNLNHAVANLFERAQHPCRYSAGAVYPAQCVWHVRVQTRYRCLHVYRAVVACAMTMEHCSTRRKTCGQKQNSKSQTECVPSNGPQALLDFSFFHNCASCAACALRRFISYRVNCCF
jgi:hypothetical protein